MSKIKKSLSFASSQLDIMKTTEDIIKADIDGRVALIFLL